MTSCGRGLAASSERGISIANGRADRNRHHEKAVATVILLDEPSDGLAADPLALHAVADADAPILPPDIDAQDKWFEIAERFLLSTLDREAVFEEISTALDHLAIPSTGPPGAVAPE